MKPQLYYMHAYSNLFGRMRCCFKSSLRQLMNHTVAPDIHMVMNCMYIAMI